MADAVLKLVRWGCAIVVALVLTGFEPAKLPAQPAAASPPDARPAPCSVAGATVMTVAQIIAAGDDVYDRCVTVEAVANGFWLEADNVSRYQRARRGFAGGPDSNSMGLYGRDRSLLPAMVRVTGRINSCARISDAITAQGGIPFLSGYCHYHTGRIIAADVVEEVRPFAHVRLTAASAPAALQSLSPIADTALATTMREAAATLLDAACDGDGGRVEQLLRASDNGQARMAPELVAHPAVRSICQTGVPEASTVLGWVPPADATPAALERFARDAVSAPHGVVCFANDGFARAGAWPIATLDTAIVAGRPYVCIDVWLRTGRPPAFTIGIDQRGAAEPDAAAG